MDLVRHPGFILKERFLDPLNVTPYRLAKCIGVHLTRVTRIIKGERAITPDTAARLGLYFGVPAEWWLEMQARYDLQVEVDFGTIEEDVTPFVRPANCAIGPKGARFFTGTSAPAPASQTVSVTEDLLERLRRQVGARPERNRKLEAVNYDSGYKAIVGVSS